MLQPEAALHPTSPTRSRFPPARTRSPHIAIPTAASSRLPAHQPPHPPPWPPKSPPPPPAKRAPPPRTPAPTNPPDNRRNKPCARYAATTKPTRRRAPSSSTPSCCSSWPSAPCRCCTACWPATTCVPPPGGGSVPPHAPRLTRPVHQPFNAFLAGFSATVGQFVLTASLRMQTDAGNKREFAAISHER